MLCKEDTGKSENQKQMGVNTQEDQRDEFVWPRNIIRHLFLSFRPRSQSVRMHLARRSRWVKGRSINLEPSKGRGKEWSKFPCPEGAPRASQPSGRGNHGGLGPSGSQLSRRGRGGCKCGGDLHFSWAAGQAVSRLGGPRSPGLQRHLAGVQVPRHRSPRAGPGHPLRWLSAEVTAGDLVIVPEKLPVHLGRPSRGSGAQTSMQPSRGTGRKGEQPG